MQDQRGGTRFDCQGERGDSCELERRSIFPATPQRREADVHAHVRVPDALRADGVREAYCDAWFPGKKSGVFRADDLT